MVGVTQTLVIIIDNDASGAFEGVVNGVALLAMMSIGFQKSVAVMLGKTWVKH
jgi:hypothetical protein